jgi:tRNA(fMet)-specific endonuclease VapC
VTYLLDTNSCIYLFSGTFPALAQRIGQTDENEIGVSAITFAELEYGTKRGKLPDRIVLDAFAAVIKILPFDEAAARIYADLPFKRNSFDRLIAAHALALGATLITRNVTDFSKFSGLKVVDWT